MTKETFMSLIRTLLTSIGVFLIGKNLMGSQIDQSILEMLIGIIMSLSSVIWSVLDKTIGIEMLQTFLRQLITGIGGLLIAKGVVTPEKLEGVVGMVTTIIPLLYSILSRKKTGGLVDGSITTSVLKQ